MKVVFLGPPGAGKGSQAIKVSAEFGLPHISTGDIFRKNIADETTLGMQVKEAIEQGELVSDEVTLAIVKKRISQPDCANGFVLDGFPRTVAQAEALTNLIKIDAVIDVEAPDEVLVERISNRRVCIACGATYRLYRTRDLVNCTACGAPVVQREDDKPETVYNRLRVYKEQTEPLVAFYDKMGLLHVVDGVKSIDDLFVDLCALLRGLQVQV